MDNNNKIVEKATMFSFLRRYLPIPLTIFVGVLLSFVASTMVRNWEHRQAKADFERAAENYYLVILRNIEYNMEALHSISAFYAASRDVERQEFREFVKIPMSVRPNIQTLAWIPRVSDSLRSMYKNSARADGFSDFEITERNNQGDIVKAGQRLEYFPIYYLETYEGNESILGSDLAANPISREAINKARDTQQVTATELVKIKQKNHNQFGLRIFLPIYRYNTPKDAPDDSRKNLLGFVMAALRVDDIVEESLTYLDMRDIGCDVYLYEETSELDKRLIYYSPSNTQKYNDSLIKEEEVDSVDKLSYITKFDIAGCKWSVLCVATAEYVDSGKTWQPWGVMAGGLLFTILVAAYFFINIGRTARIEQLVGERTTELSQANIELESEIIERLRIEVALQKAKQTADSANLAKSEFLANMSHEIRTPLNAIIGMTELALETKLNSDQQGFLNVVQSASEGLLCLINDILDFSKIEAGQMEIEKIEFKLRDVVEGAVEIFGTRAEAKGIELLCYVEPKLPTWFVGDPTRLRQIIVNLTANAIKFTEKGEVAVKVETAKQIQKSGDNENVIALHFKVSDTGIGISQNNLLKIFEKFSQADSSTTRKFGGTGLGLNISKSLIEFMGGELSVESQPGKGSTFQFIINLPIGKEKVEEVNYVYPDFKKITILVVDDNETNRFILRKTLTVWGFQVKEAQSGAQALFILKKFKEVNLAILDQQMPEMDGIELAQKIKRDPGLKDLKIIMLSSVGNINFDLKKKLNIAQYITKPAKQSKLYDILMKVLRFQKPEQIEKSKATKTIETVAKTIQRRILLVEDNLDNQKLTLNILENAGYMVDVAENGQLAIEAVKQALYDVILMDIQMPVMDGFEATKEIRALEKCQQQERVPIIALTAHALQGYREKCLTGDMDDYLTKPLKKKGLLEMVTRWIDPRPRILVVDDSVDNRNLIKNYLKKDGDYKLTFANNGQEAVDIYKRSSISLILMDMEMPIMDGYSATKAIRQLNKSYEIPVLALTAHQGSSELNKCLEAGCNAYVTKPIRKEKLFKAIQQYLEKITVISEDTAHCRQIMEN